MIKLAAAIVTITGCVDPPSATIQYLERCDAMITATPIVDSVHVPYGAPVEWPTNPPTSGTHWSVWAQWDRAYVELPRGLWLHGAEHGGVVLSSRCSDCDDASALVELAAARPIDPHCAPPLRHRLIVTSDALLPDGIAVGAVAWGVAYTASCLDPEALVGFLDDHYGRAGENTCADGIELEGADF